MGQNIKEFTLSECFLQNMFVVSHMEESNGNTISCPCVLIFLFKHLFLVIKGFLGKVREAEMVFSA